MTTTKGNNEARAARLELVKLRTSLEAKRKELKAPALERSRLIDAEAARITGEIVALERPIDEQIKADEQRREAEKEARRQAEARRVQAIADKINGIRALAMLPAGVSSSDILAGLEHARGLELFAADFDEQLPAAERARGEVVGKLEHLHAAALEHEAEKARLEAQRAELELQRLEQLELARAAAESAELERKKLEAQRLELEAAAKLERDRVAAELRKIEEAAEIERRRVAELEATQRRQQEAAELEQRRAAQALADERAAFERQQAEAVAAEAQRVKDALIREQMATLDAMEDAAIVAAPATIAAPPPVDEPPTLKLGTICERLSFTVSADFMVTLGYSPKVEKGARLFHEADFAAICQAISAHVLAVAHQHAVVTS